MRKRSRAAVVAVMALSLLPGSPPGAAQADPGREGAAHVVPLVTGDRVRVTASGVLEFLPGPGREDVGHSVVTLGGDKYVLPGDARDAVAGGKADRRLFDVSALIRDGYADRDGLPLIVTGGAPTPADLRAGTDRAALADQGAAGTRLNSIDATAATYGTADLAALWSSLGAKTLTDVRIRLDGRLRPTLDVSVPMVKAPEAWSAGFDGTGVTIAVLDTGLDQSHPDVSHVLDTRDFTGTTIDDMVGHGTHVASTAAGTGAASGGRYKGVAPGASLLIGKVCAEMGCPESAMIAGMEWAAARHATAVNMSIGGPAGEDDLVVEALERLSAETGTLFVAAAGNAGLPGSVASPGVAPSALTVGSVSKAGELSGFSSQGPTWDHRVKPDLAAPGQDITAARASIIEGTTPYTTLSGTSMAAPHVTGAVALLKQAHPDWTGARLKQALTGAAEDLGANPYQEGTGLLNVARAMGQDVFADGPVSFGLFPFPQDQPTATHAVTYTNDGDTAKTLNLTVTGEGFAVDRPSVTVPAHGTATAVVSYDPDPARPGDVSAFLVATGPVTVRTALGASAEKEEHTLTVPITFPNGEERAGFTDLLYKNLDTGETGWWVLHADEPPTRRFSPGRYTFAISVQAFTGPRVPATTIGYRDADLRADATMPLDLTTGGPAVLDVPGATPTGGGFGVTLGEDVGLFMPASELRMLPGGPAALPATSLILSSETATAKYLATKKITGPLPAGLTLASAFDRVDHVIEGLGGDPSSGHMSVGQGLLSADFDVTVPGTVTTYLSPGDWDVYTSLGDWTVARWARISTVAGGTRVVRWNRAPLGLAFTGDPLHMEGGWLYTGLSPFSGPDAATSAFTEGTLTLDVNGERVLDTPTNEYDRYGFAGDLAGAGVLRMSGVRDVPWSAIGTSSSAEFRWSGAPTLDVARLNAAGVVDGYAAAGRPQLLALTVAHGRPGSAITGMGLEVSYDDGRTWRVVPLVRAGETAMASLTHPAGATSVSTRLTVSGSGSSSVVTTIRSWGLK